VECIGKEARVVHLCTPMGEVRCFLCSNDNALLRGASIGDVLSRGDAESRLTGRQQ
jgi:hypothetical protein